MKKLLFIHLCCGFLACTAMSQNIDSVAIQSYADPKDFEIGGITVIGANFSDDNAIIGVSGLQVGDKVRIPGPDIQRAIKALWRLRLFTDVQILKEKTIGGIIFLVIQVKERPRLSRHSYANVKKSYHDDLNDAINRYLLKGGIVTENIKVNAREAIEDFFIGKGYLDVDVQVQEIPDSTRINSVRLVFEVNRKNKVKIQDITFSGNAALSAKHLRKTMDNTKRRRKWFSSSKLIQDDFAYDKERIIAYYNTIGFRDATIKKDSIWREPDGDLRIHLDIEEGQRYYFGDIAWKGNSIYDTQSLTEVLGISKGEVYNQEVLETRLRFSQNGRDISTLYMDNGYLFFQVDPIEVAINEDSIDLEIRLVEGPQATIDRVRIVGNDRTNEYVIRRELRTKPGQKFSRSDIIRSQRQIMNLGYFNPESLGIDTPVNPQRGTVDVEYVVEEKVSDQFELSAGWGGNQGVIGTIGVTFNNFSLRNIFKKEAWRPLPTGDGQRLSLRAQSNGAAFQSYNISLTEPWLGGKKPKSLTVAGFYNRFRGISSETGDLGSLAILQGSVSLGTRLSWPDDNFISTTSINFQQLRLDDWAVSNQFVDNSGNPITNGNYNNFSIKQTIARSTIDDPIFPKSGSKISLSLQITPPYSLFESKNYNEVTAQEKYRWLEYHKWRFDAEWYTPLAGDLILRARAKVGMLGSYNSQLGIIPFERFSLGGDGINNQQAGFAGFDPISLRGYGIEDIQANYAPNSNVQVGAPIFNKFTLEVRYPLSLNPSSTIYVLGFVEGGNAWSSFRDYNPFELQRSAGLGMRVFLPMFGTLGFDYGIGFDKAGERSLNNLGRFNIVLGFEPE
ncbi:MAG: outer membrane protein assembly factor BamA [Bacteroidota bacterium]